MYNKFKILTIDRLLFPEYKVSRSDFLVYRKGYPFRELNISLDDLPSGTVKLHMQDWYDWTQEEFILLFDRPCWIEPTYGWAVVKPFRLLYYSLGVSRTSFQQKPRFFKFIAKRKVIHVDRLISLRDSGEENYFHFFNDVLSKMYFLQLHKIDVANVPVVVSKKLSDKPYFKFYKEHSSFLKSIHWLIQDDEYIRCSSAIFCKPLTHRPDLWTAIMAPITIRGKLTVTSKGSKFFLTRHKSRLRFIENSHQIEMICHKHDFMVLDTDTISPEQQVEIFSTVNILIGIHGAGLTNMAFMQEKCSVLEIFPPPSLGYLPFHYIMLAKLFNLNYAALVGDPGDKYSGGFQLNANLFEKELIELESKQA